MWFSACQSMLHPAFPNGKISAVSDDLRIALLASVLKNLGLGTSLVQNARDGLGKIATSASAASAQRQRSRPWLRASQSAQTRAASSAMNIDRRTGKIARVTGSLAGSSQGPGTRACPLRRTLEPS